MSEYKKKKKERNEKLAEIIAIGKQKERDYKISRKLLEKDEHEKGKKIMLGGADRYGEIMMNFQEGYLKKVYTIEDNWYKEEKKIKRKFFRVANKYNKELRELKEKERQ